MATIDTAINRNGSVNLNGIQSSGITYCYNASTNLPVSGKGGMLITAATSGNVRQLFWSDQAGLYARAYVGTAWNSWTKLA